MDSPRRGLIKKTTLCLDPSCSSSSACTEDFGHWDAIPDVLLAKILALLPFSSIYVARAVCKRWHATIWSPDFFSFLQRKRLHMPWLLEFQQHMYNQAWAFDLETRQWFHLNFSFIPEMAIVLAAAGGLVCLGRMTQEGYVMYVCNPLTKNWRMLPSIARQPDVVLIDVDRHSHAYKVIALAIQSPEDAAFNGSVLVFNAMTGIWRETPYIPEDLGAGNLWDATISGGILYCLSTRQRIEAFYIELGFWGHCPHPSEPSTRIWRLRQLNQQRETPLLEYSYLCDRRGHLTMITLHQNLNKMLITKYDAVSRIWRLKHISAIKSCVICAGQYSSLSLRMPRVQGQSHVFLMHPKGNGHYSSGLKSYQHLPASPLTRHKLQSEEILVKGLWFEPRLDATV